MAGNGDCQPAAGIVVAEEHVGHCLAAALAGFPSLDDGGNMICFPADGKWSAINKDQNRWRTCRLNRFDQVFLYTSQIQTCNVVALAISRRPLLGFTLSSGLLTHYKYGHTGVLRCANSFRKTTLILEVYAASLGVNNTRRRRDFGLDCVKDRAHMLKDYRRRVITQQIRGAIRIGTDYRNRLHILSKRQDVIFIL